MSCEGKHHILEIEHLSVTFRQYETGTSQTLLPVIKDLNVSVHDGEIVAVVGASGSGKSLLAHAIMDLLPENATHTGSICYNGETLTKKSIAALRGHEISLVPQSVTYLDPLLKVGRQVMGSKRGAAAKKRMEQLFSEYDLAPETANLYPFECSGGMIRRILLCTALMSDSKLIIADEPTPGMQLSLAKKAMADFRHFADKGNGVLLITHDIELALLVCDRIAVFYAGTTVEEALASDFAQEETLRHPYSKALFHALPQNGFISTPGCQPYVKELPKGCVYGPRCENFTKECEGYIPSRLVNCGTVRCIKVGESNES